MSISNLEYKQKYMNWFIVQVLTNREYAIKDLIIKYSTKPVDVVVFSKEIVRNRGGKMIRIVHPLFPSYIFIKKDVQIAIDTIKERMKREFIRPICCKICFSEDSPCMVLPEEMELLFNISDNSKLVKASSCYKEGNEIKIINGPLQNLKGKILYINEKKRIARVAMSLFKREMEVNLGIDVIKKE